MTTIRFTAKPLKINSHKIILFTKSQSKKLPSRGMCMTEGTINGKGTLVPLEPDGRGSHFYISPNLKDDEKVDVDVSPLKDWPEPTIPKDFNSALDGDKKAKEVWDSVTPIAHWDWLRWVQGTKNKGTRKKRVKVAMSKLRGGKKRPCCFNRSICTIESVSKSGKLQVPSDK